MDLTGQIFGKLTVIKKAFSRPRKSGNGYHHYWTCRCECGYEVNVAQYSLKSDNTRSCGCLNVGNLTHGLSKHPIYQCWYNINQRCYNTKTPGFENWGGRGIIVCERWRTSFELFCADMLGSWELGLSLDRIDNNGTYSSENCRWVTRSKSLKNTSRSIEKQSDIDYVAYIAKHKKWRFSKNFDSKEEAEKLARFIEENYVS